LVIGAVFVDTAFCFAKLGTTEMAVEPVIFECIVKNPELNNISTDKVIPIN
jgi:hypothetical protein